MIAPVHILLEYASTMANNELVQTISLSVGRNGEKNLFTIRKRNVVDYEREKATQWFLQSPRTTYYQRYLTTVYEQIDTVIARVADSIMLAKEEDQNLLVTKVIYLLFFRDLPYNQLICDYINEYIYNCDSFDWTGIRTTIERKIKEEHVKIGNATSIITGLGIFLGLFILSN